jgi:NAD(P)H-hydrate epimerase
MSFEILNVAEMGKADGMAAALGVPTQSLMEAAGWAVAHAVWTRHSPCRVAVLCGPGNNGGDGFAAARLLAGRGYAVRLGLLGDVRHLAGDAAAMAERWPGPVEALTPAVLDRADVVVDAVFGAGLARPVAGDAALVFEQTALRKIPVVAVDVPSGVDGNTGQIWGTAPRATVTVTFFRKKPGHLLLPGREACGEVVVADIGMPHAVLDDIAPKTFENGVALWRDKVPHVSAQHHKYDRGHGLVVAGGEMTGASRLASMAARRVGAGLVTISAPAQVVPVFRTADAGTLVFDMEHFDALLADHRRNAVLIGPGSGGGEGTKRRVLACARSGKSAVLDADALTSFEADPDSLFEALDERVLITPHEGQFSRLFGAMDGGKVSRARQAAKRSGAVVLLKGADTVIAHPDGRAAINANAPPTLATAGSGDVLAGLALGLIAQGVLPFEAACMAAWIHGAAAQDFGPGLLAEDLVHRIPGVLRELGI